MKKKSVCLFSVVIIGITISLTNGNSTEINSTSPIILQDSNNVNISVSEILSRTNLSATTTSTTSSLLPAEKNYPLVTESCRRAEENVFNCKGPGGYLEIHADEKSIFTYKFILEDNEGGIIYFYKDNVPHIEENCSIKIGEILYDKNTLLKENTIHLLNISTTLILPNGNPRCYFKAFYRISFPYIASAELLDLQGTIEAPEDPDGLQKYRPMTTFVWYLQPSIASCFIELKITEFDIGSSTNVQISPEITNTPEQYDFLSIALENNGSINFEDDYTFFGKWDTPATEILPSCSARITFSSKMHFQDAKGFRIDFKAIDTILPLPVDPPSSLSTWIAINGVSMQNYKMVDDVFPNVKQVIAEMANTYLSSKKIEKNVSQDNITIYEVGTCSIFYCRYDCMAFYFSIELKNDKDEPIFTASMLNDMVSISNKEIVIVATSFSVCHEIPYINWSFPIFFLLLIILCSFSLIALAICEKDDAYKYKRRENLRYLISDWGTPWRRQSISDFSTSSASSQAPFVKKRFYFPGFGNRNKVKEPTYPAYDLTEFKDFKSKPVDPNAIGLDEIIQNSATDRSTKFSNHAFVDDDEIFNKLSNLDSPSSLSPRTPSISAEQTFHDANPFRHEMILAKNTI